jgi:hypothetical protein
LIQYRAAGYYSKINVSLNQLLGSADISVFTLLYAGQILFVPLQATKVSTINAKKTSERKIFLSDIILFCFTTIKLVKKYKK